MERRKYLFTVTFAVVMSVMAVVFLPSFAGAVMFPIVVNNCEGTGTTVTETRTVMFPIVVNKGDGTCTGAASVRRTGQETCYDGSGGTGTVLCADTGQDGELQKGTAWPTPRFTADNTKGTVTDNLTGLVWTANANCAEVSWLNALTFAKTAGNGVCGITDGSTEGTWRLPNIEELLSLVDREYFSPALSNMEGTARHGSGTGTDVFTAVQASDYWSSTTDASTPNAAWRVVMNTGTSDSLSKSSWRYVWLVRDPN